jgi:hypothetical protein
MSTLTSIDEQTNQNQPVDANPDDSGAATTRKYKSRSFNEKLGDAELLADSMEKNKDELSVRGGGEEFVNQLKTAIQDAKDLNSEQEKNKATLKDSTQQLDRKMTELDKLVSDGRNIVKMVINQKRWVEFGIKATR